MLISPFLVQGSGPERLARPYSEGLSLHRSLLVLKATVWHECSICITFIIVRIALYSNPISVMPGY
ncbi:RAB13, member RAS oncogene family, isoform CRA_b [Rattus norvegicus]|uniref:RAB13, member RAS oncogene family, isoform CRA_b n=1 Tax=Rattus norvegicus TaxID=10116 RepID=A6J6K9_RAT|nr:RAB13, member RAS oncogene family, isoform CRA_b [Rattus norvegicus]